MTNIAYKDITGGKIKIFSASPELPKWQRIFKALAELEHTGCIRIYLFKRNKLRTIQTKGF